MNEAGARAVLVLLWSSALLLGCNSALNAQGPAADASQASDSGVMDSGDDSGVAGSPGEDGSVGGATPWRFAFVADTHVTVAEVAIPAELVAAILADSPSLLLVGGDVVEGGTGITAAKLENQLKAFRSVVGPLTAAGIKVYPVRGNHENDVSENLSAWNSVFSGESALPSNGPSGEANLTYSFAVNNALFIGLDEYVSPHRVNQTWLDGQLSANTRPHIFVFGHEPAFKARHDDCLDDYESERNAFWQSLATAGAKLYLCGHDHFADVTRIADGDDNTENDVYQLIIGTGGGALVADYQHDGANAPFTPEGSFHEAEFGYLLVEVSGARSTDLGATLTWKKRMEDGISGAVSYVPAYSYSYAAKAR